MKKGEVLYFYIGEKGNVGINATPAYNGGGKGSSTNGTDGSNTGGGATDVRLVNGSWDNTSSLISRIMVAGAGGGSDSLNASGGSGGTLHGLHGNPQIDNTSVFGKSGSQTSGGAAGTITGSWSGSTSGSFGRGGSGTTRYGGGGGSGYYGGGGAGVASLNGAGGGGGSSYISGYAGVNSVEESTAITHTNETLHYSGKYFIGGKMLAGQNEGNGYAKITYVYDKPKRKTTKLDNVRYIKDCINDNSSIYHRNYWVEIQAIKDGVNIAKGKKITGTVPAVSEAEFVYEQAIDGNLGSYAASSTTSPPGNTCVTVDLGKEYNLDEIMVRHASARVSYDNITSVSKDNNNFITVIKETNPEVDNGKRINAYIDTYNGYVQDNLVLWYDGYLNSESGANNNADGHNTLSTTWKDLSGNNNDVTVSGATWYNNYLSFDGTNDYAYKTSGAIYNISKEHTIEVLLKPRKVASSYQSIFNTVNSGTNVLQYGSLWIHETMQIGFDTGDGSTTYDTNRFDIRTDDIGKYFLMTSIRNDRNYKLYNKGKFINELNYTFDARTPNPAIYIGGQSTSTNLFNGEIYSIRVYNKALTEEELLHNYYYDKEKFNLE